MHEHVNLDREFILANKEKKVLLVGQANVGKSVVFSQLTGKYVTVSNYPGTTVEITKGFGEKGLLIIDTPGVSGVVPKSEDERISFEMIANASDNDILLHVGDAKNFKRTLLLALTFAEASLPMVLNLNMIDEAEKRGISIDVSRLSSEMGIPVVSTAAISGRGMENLKKAVEEPSKPKKIVNYDPRIELAAEKISEILKEYFGGRSRFVALTLLASNLSYVDEFLSNLDFKLRKEIKKIILDTQSQFAEPLSLLIIQSRNEVVERLFSSVVLMRSMKARLAKNFYDPSFHPVFGYVILLAVLYVLYQFVGVFAAGTVVDFFENVLFGKYINPFFIRIFQLINIPFMTDLFVGEYGLITMGLTYAIAIVFPIVTAFFLVFSFLEDSGYLPRLAVLLNRTFNWLGLNGKAVVPLVLGLGCGTMATMVTRVLDTKKERIIATLLLALGIPCSAQLGVILGFFSILGFKALIFFFLLLGIQLVLVGYLSAKIIPGKKSAFITELPPYRFPQLKNIFLKTYYRGRWFVKEAIPLFMLGTFILFAADKIGILPTFNNLVSPIVKGWLDLPPKAAEAFILGFLRRDYGAAGLYALFEKGMMNSLQAFVSMLVITLFVPCIANFMMIIKERGLKTALAITGFVFVYSFLAGGLINKILRLFNVSF